MYILGMIYLDLDVETKQESNLVGLGALRVFLGTLGWDDVFFRVQGANRASGKEERSERVGLHREDGALSIPRVGHGRFG